MRRACATSPFPRQWHTIGNFTTYKLTRRTRLTHNCNFFLFIINLSISFTGQMLAYWKKISNNCSFHLFCYKYAPRSNKTFLHRMPADAPPIGISYREKRSRWIRDNLYTWIVIWKETWYYMKHVGKCALTLTSSRFQFAGGLAHFPARRMPAVSWSRCKSFHR